MNPIQNHGAAINARRRRFMMSQFLQTMKPPKAGERNRLPMIAMTGLQIVSPSGGTAATIGAGLAIDRGAGIVVKAGIVDPGPVTKLGSGGGPAAGIGIDGKGGGVALADSAGFSSSVAAALLATPEPGEGGWAASDAGSGFDSKEAEEEDKDGDGSDFAAGNAARNSAIGFQADFVSSQARSAALRLPSATFSRMADSENRPAYCPFR